jgi:hypothetical protein
MGLDARGTAENDSGSAKRENRTQHPGYRRKRVRALKKENETRHHKFRRKVFRSAKHENGTRRPQYRPKLVWERKTWKRNPTPSVSRETTPGTQNTKTGPTALGTAENDFGLAKH